MSYSARPGDLESKDDFYLLGRQMAVIESSLNNYNKALYVQIKEEALPVWIRVNLANKFSTSSAEWVDIFALHNSGTHNNQWAVVDYEVYRNYVKNQIPKEQWKNIIWLIEQFFNVAGKMDVTQEYLLNDSYFATYNFPYHQEIYDIGNYAQFNPHDQREDIFKL